MRTVDDIILHVESTISEALTVLNESSMQIILVLDNKNRLIGTLTDGDIRRGLLQGFSLDSKIEPIIFRTPTVCSIGDNKKEVLRIAVENKIYKIPIIDNEGRVVGLEEIDNLLKPMQYSNKVVIMAGGLGTRLRPLTDDTPKPLLKVGDMPILEKIILDFAKNGFKNIILSVNYKSHMIEEYFGRGAKFGVTIEYIHEDKRMGTAGALGLIKEKLTEPFFVMNGDLLTSVNFKQMLKSHNSHHTIATMGVREYDFQIPYGVIDVENNKIVDIEEKPLHKFFVNGGIYILDPDALKFLPQDSYFDMTDLFKILIEKNNKMIPFPIREYWMDIGNMGDFKRANDEYDLIFK